MARKTHPVSAAHWVRPGEPLIWLRDCGHEFISSPKYFWNCLKRPPVRLVIQLTLSGQGFFTEKGSRTLLKPGMAFVTGFPCSVQYGYPPESREVYEQLWMNLDGPPVEQIRNHIIQRFGRVLTLGPDNPIAPRMLRIIRNSGGAARCDRYLLSMQLYELLMTLMQWLNKSSMTISPLVQNAIDLIHDRGLDPDCNVHLIVAQLGCSREHLARCFRAAVGIGPAEYLNRHRLRHAKAQLRATDDKLESIAARCGFTSASYFCRSFRRWNGYTPGEYRAYARGSADPPLQTSR